MLGWLDSDDSDNELSDHKIDTQETFPRKSKTITNLNTPKRSKLPMNDGKKKHPVNTKTTVVDGEDKEALVNSVDDFIMSLQSQRKKVVL